MDTSGSFGPSERAFSGGEITNASRRSSLTTQISEALRTLKSAYRSSAVTDAALLLNDLSAALREEEGLEIEYQIVSQNLRTHHYQFSFSISRSVWPSYFKIYKAK